MSIDDYRDHAEIKCGPTHHHACDCREAKVARLVEALSFYATGDNWVPARGPDGEPCMSNTWEDAGERARAALDEWRK